MAFELVAVGPVAVELLAVELVAVELLAVELVAVGPVAFAGSGRRWPSGPAGLRPPRSGWPRVTRGPW
ncbi:hypothetical protein ACIQV3_25880 [Streptomyces sp. NPDC099050]|uniref:hypothetical protein n=1 Tax=Streptomyces sp. NPDC099050 TaxID=3366100 RepID=UPI0037FFDFB7